MINTDHIETPESPWLTVPEARREGAIAADELIVSLAGKPEAEKLEAINATIEPLERELAAIDRRRAFVAAQLKTLEHSRFVLDTTRRRSNVTRR